MLSLPNGCKWSGFHVYPKNWKTSKAKLFLSWYADCSFIDPSYLDKYPNGKPIRLKGGINRLKTLHEKREALEKLIGEMEELLAKGYNPISEHLLKISTKGQSPLNEAFCQEAIPATPFIRAFRIALEHSTNVKECVSDIRSVINCKIRLN